MPAELAKGVLPIDRKYPLGDQAPRTTAPSETNPPPPDIMREVDEHLRTWKDCLSENALIRLRRAEDRIQLDEREATRGNLRTHRQRTRLGQKETEVRIGSNDYHPVVCKVLQHGHTIAIPSNNPLRIRQVKPLGPDRWGFDANALRQDVIEIGWTEEELLSALKWGFSDYSCKTPPISSMSPHQRKALENGMAFAQTVQGEIDKGWIGEAQNHPPSIPFHVIPGSLEPKKDAGAWRLIWNSSWPKQ